MLTVAAMTNPTNGDARVEELQRHIRVLEHHLPTPDDIAIPAIHRELGRLGVDQGERHDKLLRVLNDVLTKLNQLVEAQNRTTQQFTLLLAGLHLAALPPQPRNMAKPKRARPRGTPSP